ncbi:hypothetical protein Salat_1444800 [Sesamum alatum]|uniref:Uncharacterized protein n=1 Tax=Sesamum alatum TaxID=300844 RepID=A0AAE1YAN2_9LAMI|nr:hypothetical protein Salat_1444800 [Sesamum alatum]
MTGLHSKDPKENVAHKDKRKSIMFEDIGNIVEGVGNRSNKDKRTTNPNTTRLNLVEEDNQGQILDGNHYRTRDITKIGEETRIVHQMKEQQNEPLETDHLEDFNYDDPLLVELLDRNWEKSLEHCIAPN